MRYAIFSSIHEAEAFILDLQNRGVIQASTATLRREDMRLADVAANDAAAGAAKGTGVGALVGVAAGVLGAGAVVATGGLALPVILGMTAVGAGVGAVTGAVGGANGVDENGDGLVAGTALAHELKAGGLSFDVPAESYDEIDRALSRGQQVISVDDGVSPAELDSALQRHGGRLVGNLDPVLEADQASFPAVSTVASAAGDLANAAGHKLDEGVSRLRAAGHEVAAEVTGDVRHQVLAAEDRLEAEADHVQAQQDVVQADRQV